MERSYKVSVAALHHKTHILDPETTGEASQDRDWRWLTWLTRHSGRTAGCMYSLR